MASLTDLDQVKGSLEANIIKSFPLHSAAENGHLKLMEFFFFTDADINEKILTDTVHLILFFQASSFLLRLLLTCPNLIDRLPAAAAVFLARNCLLHNAFTHTKQR